MNTFIRVLLGLAIVLTLLDIVYNGRAAAGRSLAYTGAFIVLALVVQFGTGVISQRRSE